MRNRDKHHHRGAASRLTSPDGPRDGSPSQESEGVFTTAISRPELLTVKQFCQRHPAFTQGGLRWLLFHRQDNGLERAIVTVGRRLLIDVDAFFGWLAQQNGR